MFSQAAGLPSDVIAGIEDWVTTVRPSRQRSPAGPTSSASPSPSPREFEDLRRELEREVGQARIELERERQRRDIAEAETAGLRATLQKLVQEKMACKLCSTAVKEMR